MGVKASKESKETPRLNRSTEVSIGSEGTKSSARSSVSRVSNSPKKSSKESSNSPRKVSSFGVNLNNSLHRLPVKREKIVIIAKPSQFCNKDLTESNILQVLKKNNYDFEDEELITECLTHHFFMRSLETEARREIIKEMTLCLVEQNQILFKQGALGSYFYIVKSGEFVLHVNNEPIKKFIRGDNFGELALLHGAPRSGTVIATQQSQVYCLERRNFRKIVDHINSINFKENLKFLNAVSILTHIENEYKSLLAGQLIKEYFEPGDYIVKEGDISSCLFIIKEGEVSCSSKGLKFRTLKKGDNFGERSILLETPRTLDVIAETPCVIYSITVDTLKSMVGDRYKEVLFANFIKYTFQKSKYFNKINLKLLENVYEGMNCLPTQNSLSNKSHYASVQNFSRGEVVIKTGHEMSSKVIVVIEGGLINPKTNHVIFKRGQILFEENLTASTKSKLHKDKMHFDLVAEPDCLLVEISTNEFVKHIGNLDGLNDVIQKSNVLEQLSNIPVFKNLSYNKLEHLSTTITIEKFENGKKIIIQGENSDKFYIVKSGKVDIYINKNYIRTINQSEHFGERALFFHEPRSATAQANGSVELYVIQAKDFKEILEEKLINYLKNQLYLQDNSIELKDLDFIKELGCGNFGQVALVKHRKNNHFYAIKWVQKKQIDIEGLHPNLELERNILLKIDHPFIVKLVKCLKSDKLVLFLLEYIKGKELFEVIRDIGLLNKSQTLFYGASLILAIEYLHSRNYIYRDLKPENVMISENVRNLSIVLQTKFKIILIKF
jgi:cGMP-dependent protein kinase 1